MKVLRKLWINSTFVLSIELRFKDCVCVCMEGVKGFCVRIIRFNLSRGGINEDNVMMVNPLNQLLPSDTLMSSPTKPTTCP